MLYFDYAATAPLRPVAREAWLAATVPGNAASLHQAGRRAEARLARARAQVAALFGRSAREVVWTSGGTEANNLALLGAARASGRRHVVVSAIEHKSVLGPAAWLAREGFVVRHAPVDGHGVVDLARLEAELGPETAVVSVMAVNNECGSVQPLGAIAALAHGVGALFHVDAVQAGHLSLAGVEADLLSASAHKLGGPMGVGALWVRRGVKLAPLLAGGGHERGLRPGTVNVPGVAAFGAAAEAALTEREAEAARLVALRERLRDVIVSGVAEAEGVGAAGTSAPHIVCVTFAGLDGEALVTQLDLAGLAASSGAACSALGGEPSHVLTELGLPMARVNGSLRLSLGWATTAEEVEEAGRLVVEVANRMLRTRPMAL